MVQERRGAIHGSMRHAGLYDLMILYLVYGMSIYVCSRNLIHGYKEIRYSTVPGTVCHLFVYFAKCVVPMVSSFRRRCVYCVCVCRSFSDVSLTHSRLTPHASRLTSSNTSFLSFFVLCSRILDKVERLCLYGFMLYCMYVLYLYVIMVVYTVVCTVLMYCM